MFARRVLLGSLGSNTNACGELINGFESYVVWVVFGKFERARLLQPPQRKDPSSFSFQAVLCSLCFPVLKAWLPARCSASR